MSIRVAGSLALSALLGCPAGISEADVRSLTQTALDEHAQAAVRRDVRTAASLFTDDAVVMFPGMPNVVGRDAIAALMQRAWPVINPTAVRYQTDEVFMSGGMAVTVARYWVTMSPSNQPASQDSGRYMLLWTRAVDGAWHVKRAIPNSSVPPAGS